MMEHVKQYVERMGWTGKGWPAQVTPAAQRSAPSESGRLNLAASICQLSYGDELDSMATR